MEYLDDVTSHVRLTWLKLVFNNQLCWYFGSKICLWKKKKSYKMRYLYCRHKMRVVMKAKPIMSYSLIIIITALLKYQYLKLLILNNLCCRNDGSHFQISHEILLFYAATTNSSVRWFLKLKADSGGKNGIYIILPLKKNVSVMITMMMMMLLSDSSSLQMWDSPVSWVFLDPCALLWVL